MQSYPERLVMEGDALLAIREIYLLGRMILTWLRGLPLHVKAEDKVLVPEIELAIDHHRMGPDLASISVAQLGFAGHGKAAEFLESVRRSLGEKAGSLGFIDADQHTINVVDRTLALALATLIPDLFPGLEVLADQARPI